MGNLNDLELLVKEVADSVIPNGLPDGVAVSPFSAVNATALATTAAPQAVKAAVSGKRHFITELVGVNITTGEDAVTLLQDEDDVVAWVFVPADAGSVSKESGAGKVIFRPALTIAAGKAIEIHNGAASDVGDVFCAVNGFVED